MINIIKRAGFLFLLSSLWTIQLSAGDSEYYFGRRIDFNPEIPSPRQFLGYETGTHHTRYDQLAAYFAELDRTSSNAELWTIGYTHGGRPLLVLVISSVSNLAKLEEIRLNHLKVTEPVSDFDHNSLPVINMLGFGVHGNESSAGEAAILTAWYLLASREEEVSRYLENGIFFIEPSRNPDGHDRHAQWVNSQKSRNLVSDPADLEHNETYPGGRGNHYWFDLNRDWLPAVHPESRARLEFFHKWKPHLVTCHHEMGTNSTFFFEPTQEFVRESPVVPRNHYAMNYRFAGYFASALDDIGSLYYTREDFDNFNPGFGSSYPDYNGSLAILFEQGSSRGFVQERTIGEITFQSAIRNQLAVSLASIRASVDLKEELISNQKHFFKTAFENGVSGRIKGYIFGDSKDQNRNRLFIDLLKRHQIEVYENSETFSDGQTTFYPGRSFIVPAGQAQNRMVELFFNKDLSVPDSVFYDGSTWTVVLAYGLPYAPLTDRQMYLGKAVQNFPESGLLTTNESAYAYLVEWSDYHSAAFLSGLFKKDIQVYASSKDFSSNVGSHVQDFGSGTLVIPVAGQKISQKELYGHLSELGSKHGIPVHAVATGYNVKGIDLGSNHVRPLKKPEILILTGRGISSLETGEAWYLIDHYLDMPVTRADITNLGRLNLNRYTTIVLPGTDNRAGSIHVDQTSRMRLKNWISEGGSLIALNTASEWLIANEIVHEKLVATPRDSSRSSRINFGNMVQTEGSKVVGGTILMADIDTSHPLGFGFFSRRLPVLKNNALALQFSESPYHTVAAFDKEPLISGYISGKNLERISNTAAVIASPVQQGRVILFAFNPIHRASWHSSARLFYNSVFFGQLIGGGPVRYRASGQE